MKTHKHPIINQKTRWNILGILFSGKLSGFRGTLEGHSGGYWVQSLENAFCEYFKVKYAVAMNSATSCLHVALLASDIRRYDEVIVTPYSFVSSASSSLMVGAKPVFVDINERTFNMNPNQICISPNTKVIIPVHLHGQPCDMDMFMGLAQLHKLFIIEDAAQAIGAEYSGVKVGLIGHCGVFSFNQSKQISSGEGGMLITNHEEIADIARSIRNHGEVSVNSTQVGYNFRLNEIEACIVLEQFKHLDENLDYRNELAEYMTEQLEQIEGFTPPYIAPDTTKHAWYTYAVKYDESKIGISRNDFQRHMIKRGIYFGAGYVRPLHLLPIFGGHEGQMPVAERMYKKELCVFDWLRKPYKKKDVNECIKIIKEIIWNSKR